MVHRQGGELLAPVAEQCVTVNNQRVCALLDERRKGYIDLLRVARTYDMKLKPELTRCVLRLLRVQLCIWIGRIHEQTHDRGVGYRFVHHLRAAAASVLMSTRLVVTGGALQMIYSASARSLIASNNGTMSSARRISKTSTSRLSVRLTA